MTKKRQKRNKNQQKRQILTVTIASVILIMIATAIYIIQKPPKEIKVQQPSAQTGYTQHSLSSPAVAEAKAVAEKYFEAAKNCDFEAANSMRILPKNITQTKEECHDECPGGLQYKFIKPVSYNSAESEGITTEFAAFDYVFGCGDQTHPTIMQMMRSSDENMWLVFNTF